MTCEQKLAVLAGLGQGIANEHNLESFLETLSRHASRLVGADRCSIFVYDPATHTFWSQVAEGLEERLHIPFDKGIVGACATSKETLIVNDAYGDPRFFDEIDRFTGYQTRNILAVPLLGHGKRIIGVFQVLNKQNGLFGDEDGQILRLLASHAGILLENALLHAELQNRFLNKSEQLEARNRELEAANAHIQTLLSDQDQLIKTAIHEINTPISIINTHLEVLAEEINDSKYLRRILSASKILSSVYDDFRYLLNKNRAPYPKERVDLSSFVLARIAYFDDIAAARGQRIVADIAPNLFIRFSPLELQRVIDNTLSNAVKYAPEESLIQVSLERHQGAGELNISDEGPGIKDNVRIFERYYREQERIGGFGVGLTIVKSICDENGVDILLKPRQPVGTTFGYRFALLKEPS